MDDPSLQRALYAEYLKSAEWADRRDRVMARAGGVCEGCRERAATEVHHLTYEHITREFLFELVAICGECHARYHGQPARPKPAWTPRHSGAQERLSPGAIVRRARLVELAAQARAKLMASPAPAAALAPEHVEEPLGDEHAEEAA